MQNYIVVSKRLTVINGIDQLNIDNCSYTESAPTIWHDYMATW